MCGLRCRRLTSAHGTNFRRGLAGLAICKGSSNLRFSISDPTVRIIVPARNEATRIDRTVSELCEYFGARAAILVVANACTDGTFEIVHALCGRYENLSVLEIDQQIGKGGAVRAGLTTAREPFVAFVDADGSAGPAEIDRLLAACVAADADGAIGSRWLPGSRIERRQSLVRRIASRTFNGIVRLLFGMPYSDTQCGAKVFRRSAIDAVVDELEIANFAADVDLLFTLRRAGRNVVEIPIVWSDVPDGSQVRLLRSGPAMLLAIIRLRLKHSVLRGVPFLDLLARSHVIPVVRSLRVIAVRTSVDDAQFEALVREFELQGHTVRQEFLLTPFSIVRFIVAFSAAVYREYDVILDGTGPVLARFFFNCDQPIVTASGLPAMTALEVAGFVRRTGPRRGYRAVLKRDSDGWSLASSKPGLALLERTAVRSAFAGRPQRRSQ